VIEVRREEFVVGTEAFWAKDGRERERREMKRGRGEGEVRERIVSSEWASQSRWAKEEHEFEEFRERERERCSEWISIEGFGLKGRERERVA
jgi:hypothetical protein